MSDLKIALYFIHWRDWFYLPLIKEHYGKFCYKIVMLDNHSADGSHQFGLSLGFEVRGFGYKGGLNDQSYLDVKNNVWKEERGKGVDYVIVLDCDEFIELGDLSQRPIAPVVTGYDMISEDYPIHSFKEIIMGEPSENYSKQAIFSPDRIAEIDFVHGCHKHNMKPLPGVEVTTNGTCKLFHLRRIGGVERMIERHAWYRKRLSKFNLKFNMGHHYGRPEWNEEQITAFNEAKRVEWAEASKRAIQLQ